jgi:predicted nucleic acid-binding protein
VSRLVLDASAALGLVLVDRDREAAISILKETSVVFAPGLFCAECSSGVWKAVRGGLVDAARAIETYEEALALVSHLVPDQEMAPEAIDLSIRLSHPVYDLFYAVLARRMGCPVLTRDRRLADLLDRLAIGSIFLPRET